MILFATSRNLSNSTVTFLALIAWIFTLSGKVNAECFGQLITNGFGIIESPNNGNEYGKSENCSWEFDPQSGEKGYILILTVVKLRTYFVAIKDSNKICSDSYILTINGVKPNCKTFIRNDKSESVYCHEFYSSTCPYIPTSNCKYSDQTSFPISVTYFSDGGTDSRTNSTKSNNMGFVINYQYTQCPPVGDVNITGGSGHIQSPNYGNEYGKRTNSLWKFYPPSDGREYMLLLNVTNMKNYFVISTGEAVCAGSELEINGVPTACRLIDDTRWYSDQCYQFRFSSNCPTELTSRCDHSFLTSFPINVTYFSDGRTDVNLSREYTISRGFKINYNYILCPPDTNSESLTVSTQTNAVESLPARSASTEKDKITPTPPRKQNLAPIIGGAAGGGVLLIVVLVVVVVCVIRKMNSGKEDNHGLGTELTQQQNQEDAPLAPSPDEANIQPIDAYATVGGATSINGATNAMYMSINEEGPSASNGEYATGGDRSPPTEGRDTPHTKGGATPTTGTDLYATVSKPSVVGVPTTEGVATSITGTDVYATVSKPSVKVPKLAKSSDAVYSAVQKGGGNKRTVHYNKTTVDNVLYGSAT